MYIRYKKFLVKKDCWWTEQNKDGFYNKNRKAGLPSLPTSAIVSRKEEKNFDLVKTCDNGVYSEQI